ncbi:hypothetical protein SynBIOSE41_02774 [Synechococcus sp. BIOS-E4-1]|uniref:DUF1651 domain-containing protein n=1 Tax=Synechococcus sp. BIOS-E4-1 TaxID=1400864 RepID=UPI00186186E8|nr:DUF1651 domain-containing protein [Synechococcus sp. BIOS-E4-1]QNI55263.1 hypothetical protein SynBIOSE41_02774 [Synechococcus sp. BIOS-E4-1]
MSDAWLEDPKTHWAMRFHQQSKTLDGDVQVVVENGRPMPHSQPALIKSRIHMAYDDAVSLYEELQQIGWMHCPAFW